MQETYQTSTCRPDENVAISASEVRRMSSEASGYQKVTDRESINYMSGISNESIQHIKSEVFEPISDNVGSNRRLSDPGSRKQVFENEYSDTKLYLSKPEIYEERMATMKSCEREYLMRGTSEQSLPVKQLHMYEKNVDRSASSEVHISEIDRSEMQRSAKTEHDERNDDFVPDTLDQIDDTDSANAWSNQPMTPTDLDNHPSTSSVDIFEFEKQPSRSATPQSAREYRECADSSLSEAHLNAETDSVPTNDLGSIEDPTESMNEISKILRNRMPPPIPPFSKARQKFSKKIQYTLKDGEELYKIFRQELILRVIYEFMRRRSNEKIMSFLSNKI